VNSSSLRKLRGRILYAEYMLRQWNDPAWEREVYRLHLIYREASA